jgi:hypothetical protein
MALATALPDGAAAALAIDGTAASVAGGLAGAGKLVAEGVADAISTTDGMACNGFDAIGDTGVVTTAGKCGICEADGIASAMIGLNAAGADVDPRAGGAATGSGPFSGRAEAIADATGGSATIALTAGGVAGATAAANLAVDVAATLASAGTTDAASGANLTSAQFVGAATAALADSIPSASGTGDLQGISGAMIIGGGQACAVAGKTAKLVAGTSAGADVAAAETASDATPGSTGAGETGEAMIFDDVCARIGGLSFVTTGGFSACAGARSRLC